MDIFNRLDITFTLFKKKRKKKITQPIESDSKIIEWKSERSSIHAEKDLIPVSIGKFKL